jgi:hypothetical protein
LENPVPTTDLASKVQRLLDQRQSHAEALTKLDDALLQIQGAVQGLNGFARKPGRPPTVVATVTIKSKRRGRGAYAVTAEELLLAIVKQQKNPSTKEINAMWKKQGRGGTADTPLGRLVQDKKLKRQSIPGERGSRYLLR